MTQYTDSVRERIIGDAIKLICRKCSREISLAEISKATGVVAPVFYNYFKGIEEINKEAFKKIEEDIISVINIKLPSSIPPDLKAITIAYNLIKLFEKAGFSTSIISEEQENGQIDLTPLRKDMESLFGKMKGLRYDPEMSVNVLFHQIAAHVEYARKKNVPVPDDTVENIFRHILKN